MIVSFYSFEHLYPFPVYLKGLLRGLKHGGMLVGAIPCEGGLLWGAGRYATSRIWLKRHTNINPDKIICWEHPNFADTVLNALDLRLSQKHIGY